jgi:8-oxo-dGTP pyrophosphatase MutT (NUDIX family)
MAASSASLVFHIERLELNFAPAPWPFAEERRAEIDALFAAMRRDKPELFNGRVLLACRHHIEDGVLRADFLETDYAGFASWSRWGWPEAGVRDCFSAAAIVCADGGWLPGVMAPHTFNAGQIYFPCGTPDPSDIVGDKVDLDRSMRRELKEETGLDFAEFTAEPGWSALAEGPKIVLIKVLHAAQDAESLRRRILATLANERQPELSDIRIVRGPSDFDPMLRPFTRAFLAHRFAGG